MDRSSSAAALTSGFNTAIIVPAAASTLRQAMREGTDDLHILANYYERNHWRTRGRTLDPKTGAAAQRFSKILIEQSINGTAFFLAVKLSVLTGGIYAGMLAQLGITGNIMANPAQTQAFNPAKSMFGALGVKPEQGNMLTGNALERFAYYAGAFAFKCNYGTSRSTPLAARARKDRPRSHSTFARQRFGDLRI